MTTQNEAVEIFRRAYLLQWVMIYSFGINTDLQIHPSSIPYTGTDHGKCIELIGTCTVSLIACLNKFIPNSLLRKNLLN